MLNSNLPQFAHHHKEFNLFNPPADERRLKRKAGTLLFSEANLPGHKSRKINFDDLDEDGNPSQAISRLFEKHKRNLNRKRRAEQDDGEEAPRWQPRKVSKRTAIQGVVGQEFNLEPVKNASYMQIEATQAGLMLKQEVRPEATLIKDLEEVLKMEGTAEQQQANRDAVKRRTAAEKKARKEHQYARMDKQALQTALHSAFARHRIWRIKDLQRDVKQPEFYLRGVLDEMAFQHKAGDWSGMWEMKAEYRESHAADLQEQFEGELAPERDDADITDDVGEDDNVDFEDALDQ